MGETLCSQTISTKPQWIMQGSKVMSEEPYALIGHVRIWGAADKAAIQRVKVPSCHLPDSGR